MMLMMIAEEITSKHCIQMIFFERSRIMRFHLMSMGSTMRNICTESEQLQCTKH